MSATNHRTWQQYHVGHFLTTVHLDPATGSNNFEEHNQLAGVTTELIDLMDAHRLPATWAVSDPAHSAATSRIVRSATPHELAILGDSSWIGETAGRSRFARELSRRVAQARTTGLSIRTLVLRNASIEENIDLVVKQQLTAIGGAESQTVAGNVYANPRALHYGVWEIPTHAKLPGGGGWFSHAGKTTFRQVHDAAKDAATFQLTIDACAICRKGRDAQNAVAWLMQRVANLRDRGMVSVETMAAAAARLSDVPAVRPQQSILRRVA
jgi:hypothetical protein